MMISNRLRLIYKKIRFKNNAIAGKGLMLCPKSNCYSNAKRNITIGDNCLIYGTVYSMEQGRISIGNCTCIFESSFVGSVNEIEIGNCVIISNHVKIYDNNNHPVSPNVRHEMCLNGFFGDAWSWKHAKNAPVIIEDDVWIGENSTILKGVTIGKGSIIASNSVVTKSVPPYCIAAGNPARIVKEVIDEK